MRWVLLAFAVLMLLALGKPALEIRVSPVVLLEGNEVRVQCRVPLDAQNRRLQIALEGYRYSEVPIDGDAGPVTTEVRYDHVPCDVSLASCTVLASTGALRRIAMALTVVCRG